MREKSPRTLYKLSVAFSIMKESLQVNFKIFLRLQFGI